MPGHQSKEVKEASNTTITTALPTQRSTSKKLCHPRTAPQFFSLSLSLSLSLPPSLISVTLSFFTFISSLLRFCLHPFLKRFLSFIDTLLVSASPPFPWSLNPFITSLLLEQQSYQLQILVPPLRVLASALLGVL